jgi:hypothetical protein
MSERWHDDAWRIHYGEETCPHINRLGCHVHASNAMQQVAALALWAMQAQSLPPDQSLPRTGYGVRGKLWTPSREGRR